MRRGGGEEVENLKKKKKGRENSKEKTKSVCDKRTLGKCANWLGDRFSAGIRSDQIRSDKIR